MKAFLIAHHPVFALDHRLYYAGCCSCQVAKRTARRSLAEIEASSSPQFESANYCFSCHTAHDDGYLKRPAWRGEIERGISPCPAAIRLQEELYYTERMLLAIDRRRIELPQGSEPSGIDKPDCSCK